MTTKTFDGQTAKFIASLLDAVPRDVSGETMQAWIENPRALRERLKKMLQSSLYDKKYKILATATVPAFVDVDDLEKKLIETFAENSEDYPKYLIREILSSGSDFPLTGQQWRLGILRSKHQRSRTVETAKSQQFGPIESLVAAIMLAESGVLTPEMGSLYFSMEPIQTHYLVGLSLTVDETGKVSLTETTWGGNAMDPWGVIPDEDDQFIIKC